MTESEDDDMSECGTPVDEGDDFCPECFAGLPSDDAESDLSDDSDKDPVFDDPLMLGVTAVIFRDEFQAGPND